MKNEILLNFKKKKKLNNPGIPQRLQKMKVQNFRDFKENACTIILRPKWGNLRVKWVLA